MPFGQLEIRRYFVAGVITSRQIVAGSCLTARGFLGDLYLNCAAIKPGEQRRTVPLDAADLKLIARRGWLYK